MRCAYYRDGQHRHHGQRTPSRCKCGEPWTGDQASLFSDRPALDRNTTATGRDHPETSHQAAERARPLAGTQRARILAYLVERGEEGATDNEIQEATGIILQSEIPARNSLVADGYARATDRRRPSPSGNPAIVWQATEAAQ